MRWLLTLALAKYTDQFQREGFMIPGRKSELQSSMAIGFKKETMNSAKS